MDGQSAFLLTLQTYFEHFRGLPEPCGISNPSTIGSGFRKALKAARLSVDGNYRIICGFLHKDLEYATKMVTEFILKDGGSVIPTYGVNYFRTLYFLCKALERYVEGQQKQADHSIGLIFTNLRNARMIADTG